MHELDAFVEWWRSLVCLLYDNHIAMKRDLCCRQRLTVTEMSLALALDCRTEVFDTGVVKGSEFLRALRSLARKRKLGYRWDASRGSGSHGTAYLGDRFTVVKDLTKELGPGLLADMCKQLGIRKEDL